MQALKKAERAKQNHLHEDELAKPSEEFDAVLSLAPQEAATAVPELTETVSKEPASVEMAAAPRRVEPELSLEHYDNPALSLSPLPQEMAPAAAPADMTPLDTTPPVFAAREPAADTPSSAGAAPRAARAAAGAAQPTRPEATRPGPETPRADAQRSKARTAPPPKRRAAAPRRAVPDAATIRLAVLGGVALLILCIFAFLYWRAVSGPGTGAGLPMVPMPAQTITPAGNGGMIVVAPPPGAGVASPYSTATAQPGADVSAAAAAADNPAGTAAPVPPPPPAMPSGPPSGAMAAQMHPYPSGPATVTAPAQADAPRFAQPAQAPQAQAAQMPQPQAQPRPQGSRQPVTAIDNGDIRMVRTDRPPQINPVLQDAYAAFTAGDTATAQRLYQQAQQQDPNNRDALMGLAAVALRQHQAGLAASHYLRLLELDPNDGEAASGLIGLSHGDPEQSESRLKAILERNPEAAPVLFTLGNLYAQQGRWTDAQQTYFRAWSSDPSNADYAFNVAVGLDRLNQPKLALGYYQRALALATNNPGTFDRTAAHRRLNELNNRATRPAAPVTTTAQPLP
jgi:Tfp pilus assembly protein PilF